MRKLMVIIAMMLVFVGFAEGGKSIMNTATSQSVTATAMQDVDELFSTWIRRDEHSFVDGDQQ